MRHFQKPLAGMVICGSDPNLASEILCSVSLTGFSDPDLFDHFAHCGRRLLTPPLSDVRQILRHVAHVATTCAGTR